jgi:hypothetical protein
MNIIIPNYRKWIITMWHFGRDSLTEYSGEKFTITVENAEHIIKRIYVKNFGNKKNLRAERQEYPKIPVEEIIDAIID